MHPTNGINHIDFTLGLELFSESDLPVSVYLMAALLKADPDTRAGLIRGFPELVEMAERRYNAPGGYLPIEAEGLTQEGHLARRKRLEAIVAEYFGRGRSQLADMPYPPRDLLTIEKARKEMTLTEHKVPQAACPLCGKLLNAAGCTTQGRGPEPGDVTVCIYCSDALAFTDAMGLRSATAEEAELFKEDIAFMRYVIARMHEAGFRKS